MAAKRRSSKQPASKNFSVCPNCQCKYACDSSLKLQELPCPDCGHYSSDQVEVNRGQFHHKLLIASIGLLTIPTLVILDWLSIEVGSAIGGLAGVLIMLGHLIVAVRNPNRNVDSNLRRSSKLIESEQIKRFVAGNPPAESYHGLLPLLYRQVAILLIMGIGIIGIVSAEALRRVNGWVTNHGVFPGVVGPGDHFTVHFDEKGRRSLGSIWGGTGKVLVKIGEYGYSSVGLSATTQVEPQIEGRTVPRREKYFRPWLKIQIPETENLAWRQCDLRLNLDVTFPVRSNVQAPGAKSINYDMSRATLRKDISVVMSSPHAGEIYLNAWILGGIGGFVLLVICSYAMMRSSALQVSPI